MQMITTYGFNILLFLVLFIIFIGYCWSIKLSRDYNSKIERFTNTPGEPLDLDNDMPSLSTQEYDLLCSYINKPTPDTCNDGNNGIEVVSTNGIPSNATTSGATWRKNNLNIKYFPGSEIFQKYIPEINTPLIFMGKDTIDPCVLDKSPIEPNNIIAYNDELLYVNKGTEPYKHHPVQSSIPIDISIKYKNAYYYEFDNTTYLRNAKIALTIPCDLLADAVLSSNWSDSIDPALNVSTQATLEASDAYSTCLQYIDMKLNDSESMILPGEIKVAQRSKIQLVHDIFKSYKMHTQSISMYLIDIELILYRTGKYNGKHVEVTCTSKKSKGIWIIHVVAIRILGIVTEDAIGLFPVIPIDPLNIIQLPVNSDVSTVTSIIDSPVKKAYIKKLVDAHANQYNMIGAANKKLANLLAGVARYNEVQ